MTEVISVRFKNKGKVYYFDPNGITAALGDNVIVETSKGLEFAECARGNHSVEDNAVILPLRPVIRIATKEDEERAENNRKKEAEALAVCREKIIKHNLEMKLVDVEYNFEGNKILFFFTSDGRVDFRDLVKDLAGVFKTRIELRQIGIRDEARMLGGLGICGKPFCCAQFLDDFQPVSIKMAKTQGLSLNPTKISGTCGRLMCCLKYEQNAYEDLVKSVPKVDAFVETPLGKGSVVDVNLLRSRVRVRLDEGGDTALKTFEASEVEVLGGKAARTEFLANRAESQPERTYQLREFRRPPMQQQQQRAAEAPVPTQKPKPQPEAPAAAAAQGEAQQQQRPNNRNNHRRRPQKSGNGTNGGNNNGGGNNTGANPGQPPKPKRENATGEGQSGEKKSGNRKRHRGGNRGGGEGRSNDNGSAPRSEP